MPGPDQVCGEPFSCQSSYARESTRLLEQMRRSRNNLESLYARKAGECLFIQLDHLMIVATDNEQGRRLDSFEGRACEIRAPAA